MCKDMKKIPNSPPHRRLNSPRTPKKARRSAKKSTSQQVNESTSQQGYGAAVYEFF